jgi:hypothetical protein
MFRSGCRERVLHYRGPLTHVLKAEPSPLEVVLFFPRQLNKDPVSKTSAILPRVNDSIVHR